METMAHPAGWRVGTGIEAAAGGILPSLEDFSEVLQIRQSIPGSEHERKTGKKRGTAPPKWGAVPQMQTKNTKLQTKYTRKQSKKKREGKQIPLSFQRYLS